MHPDVYAIQFYMNTWSKVIDNAASDESINKQPP